MCLQAVFVPFAGCAHLFWQLQRSLSLCLILLFWVVRAHQLGIQGVQLPWTEHGLLAVLSFWVMPLQSLIL